ncbi:MAG TPA: cell division protein FtsQ/DivIB [Chitinophagales bacterium]|nr:cell division protein FtsQ/DivIB [Chitinophagales bacterium]
MNKTVKNIIIRLSMLLGVSVFVFLMVMAKINRDESRIKKINVEIDERNEIYFVNKEQVLTVLNNRFEVKDKVLSGRDLERIEKSLSVIPQANKASAYTDDKGNLNIKIVQRQPLFRVYNMQGQSYYVDETGIKFPPSDNFSAKVPIVTGKILERYDSIHQKINSVELKRTFNTVRNINKNKLWSAMIGQYNINEKSQIELIPRFGNATIIFGDDKNAVQKLKRLDVFYFDVLKKVGWDYYKVINIMYKNQVVCLK